MFGYEMPCENACGRLIGKKGGRGRCGACNQIRRRAEYQAAPDPCVVQGFGRGARISQKYCDMHYSRVRRTGEPGPPEPQYIRGEGSIHTGYRIMRINGKSIPQHRLIVEESLGRSLWPYENVHHKNGLRADNRLENLEIWIKPQPYGQRPEDLLAWCLEHQAALQNAAAWNRRAA